MASAAGVGSVGSGRVRGRYTLGFYDRDQLIPGAEERVEAVKLNAAGDGGHGDGGTAVR